VIFKNQARGTDDKGKKKEFVNVSYIRGGSAAWWYGTDVSFQDLLRSDFHKRFMRLVGPMFRVAPDKEELVANLLWHSKYVR
jgi:hypothetical protein